MFESQRLLSRVNQKQLICAATGFAKCRASTDPPKTHSESVQKLNYYRDLNAAQNTNIKPAGWDEALPFEQMPGPKPLPIIGNVWRFLVPKLGEYFGLDVEKLMEKLNKDHGDIVVLRGFPGRRPMIFSFNPTDFDTVRRNEGVWPVRQGSDASGYYRDKIRADVFQGNLGLLMSQGEDWFKVRTVVNPILMKPKNIEQYIGKISDTTETLLNNITYFSQQNESGEMPEDFHNELHKWALESIANVTLDKKLGCLSRDTEMNKEVQTLIHCILEMFELFYKLEFLPSLWPYVSTPDWRRFVKILNFITDFNLKYVNEAVEKLEREKINKPDDQTSVLEKLLKVDKKVAVVMAIDMMAAGVDTTGRALASTLYYISKNENKQKILRDEALSLLPHNDSPITKDVLDKATYLKCVIKESLRIAPVAGGNNRTTVKNMVLGGYQIPKGVDVITTNLALSHMDIHYRRAKEFLPERWLKTTSEDISHKSAHPAIYAPFGIGSRACIGQRIANLELQIALLKIIRKFELTWPHADMRFETKLFYGIADPLKLHVKLHGQGPVS